MGKSRTLEKAVAIPLDGGVLALEGVFIANRAGDDGAVIAPPHPLHGGSMDSPVVNEIAYACEKAGIASLRFNWRGVGASAGESSADAADADADFQSALVHLEETVTGRVVACGYSFGAATALRLAVRHPRVDRAVLVAPPPSMMDAAALASFSRPLLIVVGENDTFAPLPEVKKLVASLDHSELVTVPDADHFFASGLSQIGRAISDWIL